MGRVDRDGWGGLLCEEGEDGSVCVFVLEPTVIPCLTTCAHVESLTGCVRNGLL